MRCILRGRRSICMVKLECDFSWQAQYLLRLEVAFACSAHWK